MKEIFSLNTGQWPGIIVNQFTNQFPNCDHLRCFAMFQHIKMSTTALMAELEKDFHCPE